MYCSGLLLALVLLISVQGLEVVARVRFSQSHYVVQEQGKICVEIVNDESTSENFVVSYTYSAALVGGGTSTANTRNDVALFNASSQTAQLCITHTNNDIPCEREITGTIEITNSTPVITTNPAMAHVTVEDDDVFEASFEASSYSVDEGSTAFRIPINARNFPTSEGRLSVIQRLKRNQLHAIGFTETLKPTRETDERLSISIDILDDNIALEDTEQVELLLDIPPNLCSNVDFTPFNSTTVLILDDDVVDIGFAKSMLMTKEGEEHRLCVNISKQIARQLVLQVDVNQNTTETSDVELSSRRIVFMPNAELIKCIDMSVIRDNVIEQTESLTLELSILNSLPENLYKNIVKTIPQLKIFIQDQSECVDIRVDAMKNISDIFVNESSTICFTCITCAPLFFWNLTTYQGDTWNNKTGAVVGSNLAAGVTLIDNILTVINSSLIFSKHHRGTLSFHDILSPEHQQHQEYNVYIQEAAAIISLNVTRDTNIYRLICVYKGSPRPVQTWLVNSKPVTSHISVETMKGEHFESTLTVINATRSDAYTCQVSNLFGVDRFEASSSLFQTSNATTVHIFSAHHLLTVITLLFISFH